MTDHPLKLLNKFEEVWLKAWQRELGADITLTDEEQTQLHVLRLAFDRLSAQPLGFRDHVAAQVMAGVLAPVSGVRTKSIQLDAKRMAADAYKIADAMMAARDEPPTP